MISTCFPSFLSSAISSTSLPFSDALTSWTSCQVPTALSHIFLGATQWENTGVSPLGIHSDSVWPACCSSWTRLCGERFESLAGLEWWDPSLCMQTIESSRTKSSGGSGFKIKSEYRYRIGGGGFRGGLNSVPALCVLSPDGAQFCCWVHQWELLLHNCINSLRIICQIPHLILHLTHSFLKLRTFWRQQSHQLGIFSMLSITTATIWKHIFIPWLQKPVSLNLTSHHTCGWYFKCLSFLRLAGKCGLCSCAPPEPLR